MPANLENSAVATGLEKVSFHSNPKERQCQECSNYHTIALISHTSKVMIKILQARLQQFVNCELPDVQAVLERAEEPEIKLPTSARSSKKAREFQKNIYFCFTEYAKAFDCVDHNKLWKFWKRWEYQTTWPASWETCMQVRKQQLELDMNNRLVPNRERSMSRLYIGCLFNLYAEYIMRNAGLEEAQAGKSRLPGEISITSDMQMTPPLWQKVKRN